MPVQQALSYASFAIAAILVLLGIMSFLRSREGLFARISLLLTVTVILMAIHASTEIFVPEPYSRVLYGATGVLAAVAVLFTSIVVSRFLRQATRGEVKARR
jgi:hypothetical protein